MWQARQTDEEMNGVWRSSIHHMPILNVVPLHLQQHHPLQCMPAAVKSCRAMWLLWSVTSHVLSFKPLDTCQKNTLVPMELDIGQFIATFRCSVLLCFVGLEILMNDSKILYPFPLLNPDSLPLERTHYKTPLFTMSGHNYDHKFIIEVEVPPPTPSQPSCHGVNVARVNKENCH